MSPRIVFAGGGTGGHVYPALSIADELRSRFARFSALFVGTSSGLEAKVIPGAGYDSGNFIGSAINWPNLVTNTKPVIIKQSVANPLLGKICRIGSSPS